MIISRGNTTTTEDEMKIELDYTERHALIELIDDQLKGIKSGNISYGTKQDTIEQGDFLAELREKIMKGDQR
jgi:hypothetical protein